MNWRMIINTVIAGILISLAAWSASNISNIGRLEARVDSNEKNLGARIENMETKINKIYDYLLKGKRSCE